MTTLNSGSKNDSKGHAGWQPENISGGPAGGSLRNKFLDFHQWVELPMLVSESQLPEKWALPS